jgi:hypothetical protein
VAVKTFEDYYQVVYAHRRIASEHLLDVNVVLCACGQRFWNEKSHARHVAECVVAEASR